VLEVKNEFSQATITTYVQIFVRRGVKERLMWLLAGEESTSGENCQCCQSAVALEVAHEELGLSVKRAE
jgi:hypothetical protein